MKTLTDETFEKEVKSNRLMLVDFWAERCAPCRMLAPVLQEVAHEYKGRVQFAKLDISSNNATAGKFGITAIPTMLLFKEGRQVDSIVGAVSKEKIKGMLNKHLK